MSPFENVTMRTGVIFLTGLFVVSAACRSEREPAQHEDSSSASIARAVKYEVAEEWSIPNGGYGRVIIVSSVDANETQLRALGEELKSDTKGDRNAFIFIYSDKRAAGMRSDAMKDILSKADGKFYDDHFVGTYTRNINTGYHTLSIMADGVNGPMVKVKY